MFYKYRKEFINLDREHSFYKNEEEKLSSPDESK